MTGTALSNHAQGQHLPVAERAQHRSGWAANDEVAGRLVWNDDEPNGTPYNVVVDGRTLTWDELGMALDSYEGWNFRLVIEDQGQHACTDGDLIDLCLRSEGSDDE